MSKYFLTDGHSLRLFGQFDDDTDAIAAHKVLKQFTAHNYDLLCIEDDLCRAHDANTDAWLDVEYAIILASIGLPIPPANIDEDPRYKAALDHIQDLESKLDTVQEAMGSRRAFERKLQEALDAFSSEELLDAAFEDIDVDYQPFDPSDGD